MAVKSFDKLHINKNKQTNEANINKQIHATKLNTLGKANV